LAAAAILDFFHSASSLVCCPSHDNLKTWIRKWPKSRLRNDLYCVEWGVKLYSLTHSGAEIMKSF